MEKLKEKYPVEIQWRSYELRPAGTVLPPEYKERILAARPRFQQMAKEQYGLEINSGPFGIDSRPALVGAKYAEAQGRGDAYHDAIYQAYWQEAKNIEETAVLQEVAQNAGLEVEPFMGALESNEFQEQVSADISQAFQFGLSGVPALVFENKYLVSGAQPLEVLVQVVEQVMGEKMGDKSRE